jgi:hypothetical protein
LQQSLLLRPLHAEGEGMVPFLPWVEQSRVRTAMLGASMEAPMVDRLSRN